MMLMFAILFFAIMYDAGLFEPLIRRVVASVGSDPLRVTMGTAPLSAAISLDGDGSTTVLVVVTALLPVSLRLGTNPLTIAAFLLLTNSPINRLPWGGPKARARECDAPGRDGAVRGLDPGNSGRPRACVRRGILAWDK